MDEATLTKIFLSASIPNSKRDQIYYETADIVGIRDAVRALATVVIPKSHLIWGGHPAITPVIKFVMERMDSNMNDHITLYQSNFYREKFPIDNTHFRSVKYTKEKVDSESSLALMRKRMIEDNDFQVGIFIGGMEGVVEEYQIFKKTHPSALILPIASTGAAAKIIYEQYEEINEDELLTNYAYMGVFRKFLNEYL
jgi:hypothetical protein